MNRTERTADPAAKWVRPLYWILALIKLWLVNDHLLAALGGARIDDRFFLNLAQHLLAGDWLGPYDRYTLIKGPFYSMWVAAMYLLGIPLLFSQHVLYIVSCAVFVIALRPVVRSSWLRFALYAVLVMNPMSYTAIMAMRVLREGIYPAQGLLVSACAIALLCRWQRPSRELLPWSAGLGVALATFWLNREEGVWIMPLVLPAVGLAAWRAGRAADGGHRWRRVALIAGLPIVLSLGLQQSVAAINWLRYGVFTVVEFKTSYFTGAYGSLVRVVGETWHPLVPVSREVREKIYPESPAFAELRPYLEGDVGAHWVKVTEGRFDVRGEVAGGWFMWAFRESADRAGHHVSATAARDFYRRLAAEVNTACDEGRLECTGPRVSMRPRLDSRYFVPLFNKFFEAAWFQARFGHYEGYQLESRGERLAQQLYGSLTHEPLASEAEWVLSQARGWAVSQQRPWLVVERPDGAPGNRDLRWIDTPEAEPAWRVAGVEEPPKVARFELTYRCPGPCNLKVAHGPEVMGVVPLDGTAQKIERPGFHFEIVPPGPRFPGPAPVELSRFRQRTLNRIYEAFRALVPWLGIVALLGWLAQTWTVLRRRDVFGESERSVFWWAVTGLLATVVLRLGILSMIDISTVPALTSRYLGPSHPQMLAFAVLGCVAFGRMFWTRYRSSKA